AASALEGREEKVAAVAKEIEKDLKILGCTAIEDRLQEGVPEAIDYLLKAGLQVWVLTGDKTETAINIAYAANVLKRDGSELIVIREKKFSNLTRKQVIKAKRKRIKKKLERAMTLLDLEENSTKRYALVIDGDCLKFALESQPKLFA